MTEETKAVENDFRDEDLEILYKSICDELEGRVVSWRGLKIPRIKINGPFVSCEFDTIMANELKGWIKDTDTRDAIVRHIRTKHAFHGQPMPEFNTFIYDDLGIIRKDLCNATDGFGGHVTGPEYSYKQAALKFDPHLPPINKNAKEDHMRDFEDLLFILAAESEENYECLKRYIAQYAFETRKLNRPTLILEGQRSGGKNFLCEGILSKIWPMEYKKSPSNFTAFTSFTDKKLVFFDEVRTISDTNVYDMIKNLSGSQFLSHNQKFLPERMVEGKTHVVISSNGKPIHIPYREIPTDPKENQWLCIHYTKALAQTFIYRDLMSRRAVNGNLDTFIDLVLGKWLHEVALPIYQKEMLHKTRPRYGFEIPINSALLELVKMSETDDDSNALHIFEHIYNISPTLKEAVREDIADHNRCLDLLIEDHILINDVINVMLKKMRFNMSMKKFVRTGEKFKIITGRVKKQNKRGLSLDWKVLGRKMSEYDDDRVEQDEIISKEIDEEFDDLTFG